MCARSALAAAAAANFGKSASDTTRTPRAAVFEHEPVIVRGQQRVDRHGYDSGLDGAEKRGRPVDAVRQTDQHALLAAHAEPAQHVAEAVDAFGERAVGPALALVDIDKPAGSAGVEIAPENVGREIVVARNRGDRIREALNRAEQQHSSRRFPPAGFPCGRTHLAHVRPRKSITAMGIMTMVKFAAIR